MKNSFSRALGAVAICLPATGAAQEAVEVNFLCSSDVGACKVWREQLDRFEADNPDIRVVIEEAPFRTIVESLPVQLEAGGGPDISRVTDLGGLNPYYLDISPYVDTDWYESAYGPTLTWLRGTKPDGSEIFGYSSSLAVSGPFVNKTLFDQAEIELPAAGATWEEWAEAARKVAEATQTQYAMAMDRSGHRFAALAITYGAELVDTDGNPVDDEGLQAASRLLVDWHSDGTMPRDLWGGTGGATQSQMFDEFRNGNVVFYYGGSWYLNQTDQIGDLFDWVVVPAPCGPANCSGMPGGGAIVAFGNTQQPEAVARVVDFMAQTENNKEVLAATAEIPANLELVNTAIDYGTLRPAQQDGIAVFTAQIEHLAPQSYRFQGWRYQRAMMNAMTVRIGQAINKELTVDQAVDRIVSDTRQAVDSTR